MKKPKGYYRYGATARTPVEAALCYWYGLSGAAARVAMELYRHPAGCRVDALLTSLESDAQSNVVAVYVCFLRAALREAMESDAETVETIPGPIPSGPYSSTRLTRYRLTPPAREEMRDTLSLVADELSDLLDPKRAVA